VPKRIKEHGRNIRLARTQAFAVSEHAYETSHYPIWNEVKFIDRDPHLYTRRIKKATHIRLHLNIINRGSGIEIPEAWMPTIKMRNKRRTAAGATRLHNGTMAASECINHSRLCDINDAVQSVDFIP